MKRLSDYKDTAALEIWVELLDPMTKILADPKLKALAADDSQNSAMNLARFLLKNHQSEVVEILKLIDDSEITAVNLISRTLSLINDFSSDRELLSFFVAPQSTSDSEG